MKFDLKSSETLHKLSLIVTKASGYSFFSMKRNASGVLEMYQSVGDYAVFCISLLFSFLIACNDNRHSFEVKSVILSIGTALLYKLTAPSAIISKIINFLAARRAFRIMKDFQWIDRQVGQILT